MKNVLLRWASTLTLVASPLSGAIVTLIDGNTSLVVDPVDDATGDGNGAVDWVVDGQDQLQQQWFWFRKSTDTRERRINDLSAPVITTVGTNEATFAYSDGSLGISVTYELNGGPPGTYPSIDELITLTNHTRAALTLDLFQYSNFDLLGDPSDEEVFILANGTSIFQNQSDFAVIENVNTTTVPPSRIEANTFDATLSKLDDSDVDDLATAIVGFPGATDSASGDVTWAIQWSITLDPGEVLLIEKDKQLSAVPEARSFALLAGMFSLAWIALRRRGTEAA